MKKAFFATLVIFMILVSTPFNKTCLAGYTWDLDKTDFVVAPNEEIPIYATIHETQGFSNDIWNMAFSYAPFHYDEQNYYTAWLEIQHPSTFTIVPDSSFLFGTLQPTTIAEFNPSPIGQTFHFMGTITWWDPGKSDGTYGTIREDRPLQFTVLTPTAAPEPVSMLLFGVGGLTLAVSRKLRRKK